MERFWNALMLGPGSGVGFYGIFWVLTSYLKIEDNLALGILLITFIGGLYGFLEYLINDLAVMVEKENDRNIKALGYIADRIDRKW